MASRTFAWIFVIAVLITLSTILIITTNRLSGIGVLIGTGTLPRPRRLVSYPEPSHSPPPTSPRPSLPANVKYGYNSDPIGRNSYNSTQGIVLAERFSDQVTIAASNMMELQCWAGQLNVKVVEPFLIGSNLMTDPQPDHLRFGKTFNITYWNEFCERQHFGLLISWKQFLCQAPRFLILVHVITPGYRRACKLHEPDWSKLHRFTVVKKVCINMTKTGGLMTQEFNSLIFGKFSPHNVTVLFLNNWMGIRREPPTNRFILKDTTCDSILRNMYPTTIRSTNWTKLKGNVALFPSNEILKHSEEYTKRYLHVHNSEYIAVMLRMERLRFLEDSQCGTDIDTCIDKVISLWKDMRRKSGLNVTFLASDVGRYGTTSRPIDSKLQKKHVSKIFQTLANSTLEKYDMTFETITGKRYKERGYVSVLQKTVASRAKCLLLLGGGAYQGHTLHLYKELHPILEEQCFDIFQ